MSAWEGSVWQAANEGLNPVGGTTVRQFQNNAGCAAAVMPGTVTYVTFPSNAPHIHSWKKAPNADAISCSACGFIVTGAELGAMNMAIKAVGK